MFPGGAPRAHYDPQDGPLRQRRLRAHLDASRIGDERGAGRHLARGIEVGPEAPLAEGSILRVVVSARRAAGERDADA